MQCTWIRTGVYAKYFGVDVEKLCTPPVGTYFAAVSEFSI